MICLLFQTAIPQTLIITSGQKLQNNTSYSNQVFIHKALTEDSIHLNSVPFNTTKIYCFNIIYWHMLFFEKSDGTCSEKYWCPTIDYIHFIKGHMDTKMNC